MRSFPQVSYQPFSHARAYTVAIHLQGRLSSEATNRARNRTGAENPNTEEGKWISKNELRDLSA